MILIISLINDNYYATVSRNNLRPYFLKFDLSLSWKITLLDCNNDNFKRSRWPTNGLERQFACVCILCNPSFCDKLLLPLLLTTINHLFVINHFFFTLHFLIKINLLYKEGTMWIKMMKAEYERLNQSKGQTIKQTLTQQKRLGVRMWTLKCILKYYRF